MGVTVLGSLSARRAWIEMESKQIDPSVMQSLSARRAWIEISIAPGTSVFRGSLSARRAWIEISEDWLNAGSLPVALRKESVDRNFLTLEGHKIQEYRRSPQGERG